MFSQRFISVVFASLLISSSSAITLTQLSQLTTTTYDYIIVGAGTAGLVLANRLTENPNVTVLVLEAGVSDDGVIPVIAPFLGPTATPNTPYDWNYTVTAQAGMNGRSFAYPRGRILGGSSSVNYLIHQYGSSSDWDRYALVTGEATWAWAYMKQYVQKHEQFVPPVDGHNTNGQYIPSLHGFNGLVKTTLPAINMSMDHRVMMTTGQLSSEFPYNADMSGGSQSLLGMGFAQSTTGGGVRSSSSTSYLAAANSRPNLTVLINATVMKLIQTGNVGLLKSFKSLQFGGSPGTDSAGTTMTATARKEIILSAGSIGSVQILQLSGIGRASDLSALGITTLINNSAVGDNLSDHVFLPNIFSVSNTDTLDPILRGDPSVVGPAITQWTTDHTGVIANCVVNNMGFSRIPFTNPVFLTTFDPASGPTSPHWELLPTNFFINPGTATPPTGNYMTMVTVLISPTSRGTIKIQSTNPFDKPIINPNFLTTNFDIVAMRESVKAAKRFVAAPAWSDALIGPYGSLAGATTDAQIDAYIRGIASTIFHPTGSLSMSSVLSLPGIGALNPDLTVKGADGLRVVDASAFPFIPSSHTQGPTYLLAERAADFIKARWQ